MMMRWIARFVRGGLVAGMVLAVGCAAEPRSAFWHTATGRYGMHDLPGKRRLPGPRVASDGDLPGQAERSPSVMPGAGGTRDDAGASSR
jgi:hypothetical protein